MLELLQNSGSINSKIHRFALLSKCAQTRNFNQWQPSPTSFFPLALSLATTRCPWLRSRLFLIKGLIQYYMLSRFGWDPPAYEAQWRTFPWWVPHPATCTISTLVLSFHSSLLESPMFLLRLLSNDYSCRRHFDIGLWQWSSWGFF